MKKENIIMITNAHKLKEIIDSTYPRLRSISESRASEKPYPEKWSIKEILGHLIDSASNNHQRIVRMQEIPDIGTFRYMQLHWVSSQNYQKETWLDIVEFWHRYNAHLSHIIAQIAPSSLAHVCDVGLPQPVTLEFIIEDYINHLEHHVGQILSDTDPRERKARVKRDS
jgi:hypothetical protein